MGKNGYLDRRKVRDDVMQDAIKQTYMQYMTDMLILTLNDPSRIVAMSFCEPRSWLN